MNKQDIEDYLDSFRVMLELCGSNVDYHSDHNSITIREETKSRTTINLPVYSDIISVYILKDRYVIYANDYSSKKYSKIMVKIKKFAMKNKEVNMTTERIPDGLNIQLVVDDPKLMYPLLETVVQGVLAENDSGDMNFVV